MLDLLARNMPTLVVRCGVDRLARSDSTLRDSARADSDIDILVAFDGPATSERYFGASSFWRICSAGRSIPSPTRRCGLSCFPSSNVRQFMSERDARHVASWACRC